MLCVLRAHIRGDTRACTGCSDAYVLTPTPSFCYYKKNGMATSSKPKLRRDSHSDYESDFDTDSETLINNLLAEFETSATKSLILESIEDVTGTAPTGTLHVPKTQSSFKVQEDELEVYLRRRALRSPSVEVEYDESSRTSWSGNYRSIFLDISAPNHRLPDRHTDSV